MVQPVKTIIVCFLCWWQVAFACSPSVLKSGRPLSTSARFPRQACSVSPTVDWRQIATRVDHYVKSVLSRVGSEVRINSEDVPPSILYEFPTVDSPNLSVDLVNSNVDRHSLYTLTLPSYGTWTENGWQIRFRGTVYKQPNISNRTVDRLARLFLLGSVVRSLGPAEYAHLMKMVRGLFMLLQRNVKLLFKLKSVAPELFRDHEKDLFSFPITGGLSIDAPGSTNFGGDFDFTLSLSDFSKEPIFQPGDATKQLQVVNVQTERTDTGHPLVFLVPASGHTIVSDIDDVLRVSTIFQPKEGLKNLLTRTFYPWMNMPEIFAQWGRLPGMHFHYLTTAPMQMAQSYMDFVFDSYPAGTFDARIVNISDIRSTLSVRKFLLEKVLQAFPHRKFTLVGDSSNFDIMEDYPKLAIKYPERIQCILMRNTSATDDGHWVPYNTKWFRDIDQKSYMFFRVPDDLRDLDIVNGQCYNTSVPQNLTFGWQGLPFRP